MSGGDHGGAICIWRNMHEKIILPYSGWLQSPKMFFRNSKMSSRGHTAQKYLLFVTSQ